MFEFSIDALSNNAPLHHYKPRSVSIMSKEDDLKTEVLNMKDGGVIDFKARLHRYDMMIAFIFISQFTENSIRQFPFNLIEAFVCLFIIERASVWFAKWSSKDAQ